MLQVSQIVCHSNHYSLIYWFMNRFFLVAILTQIVYLMVKFKHLHCFLAKPLLLWLKTSVRLKFWYLTWLGWVTSGKMLIIGIYFLCKSTAVQLSIFEILGWSGSVSRFPWFPFTIFEFPQNLSEFGDLLFVICNPICWFALLFYLYFDICKV